MKRKTIHTNKHIADNKNINFLLHHITDCDLQNMSDYDQSSHAISDHKHNYYIFFFLQGGIAKIRVDFKEIEFSKSTVYCITPPLPQVFRRTLEGYIKKRQQKQ